MRFVTKTIHAWLHYPVAFALIGQPLTRSFSGLDTTYYWLNGVAVVTVTGPAAKPEFNMISA